MTEQYRRDLIGYGQQTPHPHWPDDARVAVSFVLNYEEGAERNVPDGDAASENYLLEVSNMPAIPNQRSLFAEDAFEYGSRAGFWRLMRTFQERHLHFTCWGVGLALERHPEAARAMAEAGHEVASHSWRWIDYSIVPEEVEREDIRKTITTIERLVGTRPYGWYTGRYSANTFRLLAEEGGTVYLSDFYSDDLPFWRRLHGRDFLIIPYALDTNDFKYYMSPGWMSGEDFFAYLKASFDCLYREGEKSPKMLSIGLHARITGRPGRAMALARFLDYVMSHEQVWVCKRLEVAKHWQTHFPSNAAIASEHD
jgi:putative urate catabolism protein